MQNSRNTENDNELVLPEFSSVGPKEKSSSPRATHDAFFKAAHAWEEEEKKPSHDSLQEQRMIQVRKLSIPYAHFEHDLLSAPEQMFFNGINSRTKFEKFEDLLNALTHLSCCIGALKKNKDTNADGLHALLNYQQAIEAILNVSFQKKLSAFRSKETAYVIEVTWRLMMTIKYPENQANISRGFYIAKKLARYMDMKKCVGGAAMMLAGAGISVVGAGGSSSSLFYKGGKELLLKSIEDRKNKEIASKAACYIFTDGRYELTTPSSRRNMNKQLW